MLTVQTFKWTVAFLSSRRQTDRLRFEATCDWNTQVRFFPHVQLGVFSLFLVAGNRASVGRFQWRFSHCGSFHSMRQDSKMRWNLLPKVAQNDPPGNLVVTTFYKTSTGIAGDMRLLFFGEDLLCVCNEQPVIEEQEQQLALHSHNHLRFSCRPMHHAHSNKTFFFNFFFLFSKTKKKGFFFKKTPNKNKTQMLVVLYQNI